MRGGNAIKRCWDHQYQAVEEVLLAIKSEMVLLDKWVIRTRDRARNIHSWSQDGRRDRAVTDSYDGPGRCVFSIYRSLFCPQQRDQAYQSLTPLCHTNGDFERLLSITPTLHDTRGNYFKVFEPGEVERRILTCDNVILVYVLLLRSSADAIHKDSYWTPSSTIQWHYVSLQTSSLKFVFHSSQLL